MQPVYVKILKSQDVCILRQKNEPPCKVCHYNTSIIVNYIFDIQVPLVLTQHAVLNFMLCFQLIIIKESKDIILSEPVNLYFKRRYITYCACLVSGITLINVKRLESQTILKIFMNFAEILLVQNETGSFNKKKVGFNQLYGSLSF